MPYHLQTFGLEYGSRKAPCFFIEVLLMKRTIVYIDGFNFYYRCLKDTSCKWINLEKFVQALLPPDRFDIIAIKYFTAPVKPRPNDPNAPKRQNIYWRALTAFCPKVQIIKGHFLSHTAKRPLAPPEKGWANVILTEEKGTDVNLSVHLLNDAWLDAYDCAAVISNDSDLAEGMRLAKNRGKLIGWLATVDGKHHPSQELSKIAEFRKTIRKKLLASSQLPETIPGTEIRKPESW